MLEALMFVFLEMVTEETKAMKALCSSCLRGVAKLVCGSCQIVCVHFCLLHCNVLCFEALTDTRETPGT